MFYANMATALLVTVLVGFAPTFYLRAFFDGPDLGPRVWVHGIALSLWFGAFWLQARWAAKRRLSLHRRFGWIVVAIGCGAAVTSAYVTTAAVWAGTIMAATVWSNLAASLAFIVFLGMAVVLRRELEVHKRLMLLASIAYVQPAVARMGRWPVFDGLDMSPLTFGLFAAMLFLLPLVAHDWMAERKVHRVTAIGGLSFVAFKLIAVFVVATSA